MHGTTMIFLFVMPDAGGLRQLRRAAHDRRGRTWPSRASTRCRSGSCPLGGLLLFSGFAFGGAASAGWTFYAPLVGGQVLGHRAGPVDPGPDLLIGMSSILGADQLPGDDLQAARAGHDAAPHAHLRVDRPGHEPSCCCSPMPVLTSGLVMLFIDRNYGGELLRPGGRRQRDPVAERVLVLRPPRGLHHDPAGVRDHQRGPARSSAASRSSATRRSSSRPSSIGALGFSRLGPPHVHHGRRLPALLQPPRRSSSRSPPGSSCSTGWPPCGAASCSFDTPMLFAIGFLTLVPDRRPRRRLRRRRAGRLRRSTTPTGSSRTCTTCCSAARSSAIFAGIYYWFPKMTRPDARRAPGQGPLRAHVRRPPT